MNREDKIALAMEKGYIIREDTKGNIIALASSKTHNIKDVMKLKEDINGQYFPLDPHTDAIYFSKDPQGYNDRIDTSGYEYLINIK